MSVLIQSSRYRVPAEEINAAYLHFQKRLLNICLLNFFVLALVGVMLRAYPLISLSLFSYKNLLHAHSHFAFGGWLTPALLLLLLKIFPELRTHSAWVHWRNSIVLLLFSAYGMLLSFPFQGYGPVSILFSTLSIAAGFYTGTIIYRIEKKTVTSGSWSFLTAGFFYFFLAAVGPFATGPLIAMGKAGTPLYYNAIYFYLHFQYNGFFTFIILAVLYKIIERNRPYNNGQKAFRLFNIACIPAYLLSVLWTQPSILLNVIGGIAALLQLIAIVWLLQDVKRMSWDNKGQAWLFSVTFLAFILKCLLQLASAFPLVADLAYRNRNFIIAYLHLVLLGFASMFVLAALTRGGSISSNRWLLSGLLLFSFAFFSTELLLVLQSGGLLQVFSTLTYTRLLLALSAFFPLALIIIKLKAKESFCLQLKT